MINRQRMNNSLPIIFACNIFSFHFLHSGATCADDQDRDEDDQEAAQDWFHE
jgi:hypothetical protein